MTNWYLGLVKAADIKQISIPHALFLIEVRAY